MKIGKHKKTIALVIAFILLASSCSGLFALVANASTTPPVDNRLNITNVFVFTWSGVTQREVTGMRSPRTVNIRFSYIGEIDEKLFNSNRELTIERSSLHFPSNSAWSTLSNTNLVLRLGNQTSPADDDPDEATTKYHITATLNNARYNMFGIDNNLVFDIRHGGTDDNPFYQAHINGTVPSSVFAESSSSGSDDKELPTPEIVVENVVTRDTSGNVINEVSKNTPFTVEITYVDFGLMDYEYRRYREADLEVFMTSAEGIIPTGGTRGILREIDTTASDRAPRFRAIFQNLIFDGNSNNISFRAQYRLDGDSVHGTATGIRVHQAKTSETDKDNIAPLRPHIIISNYSYGGEQINAGDEFTLNLTIKNTSSDIPLDNVLMRISPQATAETTSGSTSGGLTITSSSNTIYIESLPAQGTMSYSIGLRAEANAAVGSHRVSVGFEFEYIDDVNEKRANGENEENITVPVYQVDRFSVDPITDISEILAVGETGYVTVSFVNRGKSKTYNISGTVMGDIGGSGVSQHFGNLDAGAPGSLDFDITSHEPGEVSGEILIQYEDENNTLKEITLPFTVMVEMPMRHPPSGGFDMGYEPPTEGPPTGTTVLSLVGSMLMAVPVGLYLFKRIRAKGIEELDEDF